MKWFSTTKKKPDEAAVQTAQAPVSSHPFSALSGYIPLRRSELGLYASLREAVPVIDAALSKIKRLLGSFEVSCEDSRAEKALRDFLAFVKVGGLNTGFHQFLNTYFDQLLTFGTAVGEVVFDESGSEIVALYNASLENIELKTGDNPLDVKVCVKHLGQIKEAPFQDRIAVSLLNPIPGTNEGTSMLKGLEFSTSILLKVFSCMGQNFERVGNVRFAVTYNPPQGAAVSSKQKAQEIAKEWQKAMRDGGRVCDFVSVGDVKIKAIGADNQILDFEIPVKQLCEQIISKLSIPPFMLGLSWSTTERMSTQQADILMSELEYYRSLLTPVILKVSRLFLKNQGYDGEAQVVWSEMKLQDETEIARARLQNAQAAQIESSIKENNGENKTTLEVDG